MRKPVLLIYGSYGYTGRLVTAEAFKRGLRPVLAGRDGARLARQAQSFGLPYRAFDLDDSTAMDAALQDVRAVIHCAGPFRNTAAQMAAGCLRNGAHYMDITGEIPVYQALASLDGQARSAGVMLLPGIGFDVVPTDCLAAHLHQELPDAVRLELAFRGMSGASRGTMKSGAKRLPSNGLVRQDGRLTEVPIAGIIRQVDFGRGFRTVVSIPWGDVFTAYYSTGIPNIIDYIALSPRLIPLFRLAGRLPGAFGSPFIQWLIQSLIEFLPEGPDLYRRRNARAVIWGQVWDGNGETASARLETPEAYRLTALAAVHGAQKALQGFAPPGYQTPSSAYGPGFVLEIEGVHLDG